MPTYIKISKWSKTRSWLQNKYNILIYRLANGFAPTLLMNLWLDYLLLTDLKGIFFFHSQIHETNITPECPS